MGSSYSTFEAPTKITLLKSSIKLALEMYRKLIVLVLVVALSWATQLGNEDDSYKNDVLDGPEVIEETIFAAGSNDPTENDDDSSSNGALDFAAVTEETILVAGSNDPTENDDDSFNNGALDFVEVTEETIFAAGSNDPTDNDDDSFNNGALDFDEVPEETVLTDSMSTTRKPLFKVNPESEENIKNFFSNAVNKIAKWFG